MASLPVVDKSHFEVGLCWWCLSGLFARHAVGDVRKNVGGSEATGYGGSTP
jgi:hypothetical protein